MYKIFLINQNQRTVSEKVYTKEYVDIKYAYEMKCKEIYAKIATLVTGSEENVIVTPEDQEKYKLTTVEKSEEKGIPEFWGLAIANSKNFYSLSKMDSQILKFLEDVCLDVNENKIVLNIFNLIRISKFISNLLLMTTLAMMYLLKNINTMKMRN